MPLSSSASSELQGNKIFKVLYLRAETGGEARIQAINAYTWGNYLAYDLNVEQTWVKAATGAQVKVQAGEHMSISSTSKATVGYWGDPGEKQISTSVGGEVTQLTE